MGYNLKPNAVARVRVFLDQMVASDKDLVWQPNSPRFSYHLREGIAAAQYLGLRPYAELSSKFIIRVTENGRVKAELRNKLPSEDMERLRSAMERVVISNVHSAVEVVGAAVREKAPEMFFPDATLREEEVVKIYKWTSISGYYIIWHDVSGLTLTTKDPGELAFAPSA
jgi:hypothetical protein